MTVQKLPEAMLEGYTLVKHIEEKEVGSLVVLEDKTLNPVMSADVIQVSCTTELKPGDRILVNSNAGINIVYKGETYLIIREKGNAFAIL